MGIILIMANAGFISSTVPDIEALISRIGFGGGGHTILY